MLAHLLRLIHISSNGEGRVAKLFVSDISVPIAVFGSVCRDGLAVCVDGEEKA